MSIRLRLTLWYVALLCLGLALFAGAVLWQTDRHATATLDQMLRQRAQDVKDDLRFDSPHAPIVLKADSPDESSSRLGEATLWIRVLNPQGRVAVRQGPPLPGLSAALLSGTELGLRTAEAPGDHHVRVYTVPVVSHGRRAATIQVITTTQQVEEARDRLLTAMGGAGVLVVLVAALGGLFLADRSLRPMSRLTQLAGEIGAGDLHRRVGAEMWGRAARPPGRNDELVHLAQTFDGMLARLQDAGERRRRLTADAAHELCTPVATIASSAEIALRHPRDPDEYRAALEHVLEESRHMGRMVADLLLLAQADAGRLPLHHDLVELDDVCRQAVRAFQPLAIERGIALTAAIPDHVVLVRGDELRLGQVIRNLLDNALRYTPAGGTARLDLGYRSVNRRPPGSADVRTAHAGVAATKTRSPGNSGALLERPTGVLDGEPALRAPERAVIVRLSDTGAGIPLGERAHVFERFHRAAPAAPVDEPARAGGSGLGLAICKAIVEAHGGRITLEDGDSRMQGHASSSPCQKRRSGGHHRSRSANVTPSSPRKCGPVSTARTNGLRVSSRRTASRRMPLPLPWMMRTRGVRWA